jgi:hypothetical protein
LITEDAHIPVPKRYMFDEDSDDLEAPAESASEEA